MTDLAPPPPQKSRLPWILAACGGCGCLGLLAFIAMAVAIPFMLTQGAVDAAQAHVTQAGAGNVDMAYAGCASAFREATSLAQFQAFVEANPRIYKSTALSFSNRKVENDLATLTGTASGPEGDQALEIRLRNEGGAWKVEGLDRK